MLQCSSSPNKVTMLKTTIIQCFLRQFTVLLIFLAFQCLSLETDTISSGLVIRDPDTIVSQKQLFKLGFFSPANTTNHYLAVYYVVSEETVVWIANRDTPLIDSSGAAFISDDGNLILINARNQTIWSTNASTSPINTTLQILDTGNLLLRDNATGATIWESFSQPSNVFMPNMRLIDAVNTGTKVVISSWKNASSPEAGSFASGLEALNIPQIFIWNNGRPHWRSGPWNGLILIGTQDMYSTYNDEFSVVNDHNGTSYFTAPVTDMLMKIDLNSSGSLVQSLWADEKKSWDVSWVAPKHQCDVYGTCGPFGSCDILDSNMCSCLRGFEPVNKSEWDERNWSSGCKRMNQLQCDAGGANGDDFLKLPFMKVPDFAQQFSGRQVDECRSRCLGNCSCIAYAHDTTSIGCMLWTNTLVDIQKFSGVGVDLYIRLSPSDFDDKKDKKVYIIIPVVVGFVCISAMIFIAWYWMVKRESGKPEQKKMFQVEQTYSSDSTAVELKQEESEVHNIEELPIFTFETIAKATDQFNKKNLLGMGGFGPVYKGNLADGKEIAVKRLSATSGQGGQEFKNEVIVISKLQHRNLVQLLGYCVEKEEKMLIYEYMPNKSLDVRLFDPTNQLQKILDWSRRFNIIEGIGRGLLYLHRDSRLRIIHRDLKPSNVLLDEDWNPKISDFGMARIFGGNQDHGNTARVVGTYGYMAPEYAMEGRFSEKSDVYSFGILMLEILKGKKNAHYYNDELSLSLIGCAWKMWREDECLGFADESVGNLDLKEEITRCVHIALLCIQEYSKDRPTIQTVLSMLSHEIVDLPAPEQPAFAEKWNGSFPVATGQLEYSVNELTITDVNGR